MTKITLLHAAALAAAAQGLMLAQAAPASAQQFNCREARLKAERTICDSDRLSALDERMTEIYDDLMRAYSSKHDRNKLRRYQRAFLVTRNDCRSDRECIKGAYLDQISVLEERLEMATRRSER